MNKKDNTYATMFTSADNSQFKSLASVMNYFDNDATCKNFLEEQRWGKGDEQDVVCPYCGAHHCRKGADGRFICSNKSCKRKFTVTVGTIFHASKLSLSTWFAAMYIISSHKNADSSHQLARDLEITQKTAWSMLGKIRTLFVQDDAEALDGEVEMDEMYLGGQEKFKHADKKTENNQGRSTKTKAPIFGMMSRGGKFVALQVEDCKAKTLEPIIKQFVAENSVVYTDEYGVYNIALGESYEHYITRHHESEFVVRENGRTISSCNIENAWRQFRRMVATYVSVSKKHLMSYINEFCFRFNSRKQNSRKRFEMMFNACVGKVFTYDMLIAD